MEHTLIKDTPEPTIDDLRLIRQTAERLIEVELQIADHTRQLKELEKERLMLTRERLPDIMGSAGVTSIGVRNVVVEIEPLVLGELIKTDPKAREAQIDWVVDNGYGGIVRRSLEMDFPIGNAEAEHRVVDAVKKVGKKMGIDLAPRIARTIHHASYSKFARDLIKDHVQFPLDVLNVFVGRIAVVTDEGGKYGKRTKKR